VLWIVLGVVLVLVGIAGIGSFIWQMVDPGSDKKDDAVARGVVAGLLDAPTPAATFVVEVARLFTVWLDDGGVLDSGARDNIVAAVNCEAILGFMAIARGWMGGVRTRKRRTRGSVAPHEL
jgi:hypothetical protein